MTVFVCDICKDTAERMDHWTIQREGEAYSDIDLRHLHSTLFSELLQGKARITRGAPKPAARRGKYAARDGTLKVSTPEEIERQRRQVLGKEA